MAHHATLVSHEYKPLAERHIRLLKLPDRAHFEAQPTLVDVPLDAAPPYETVSYVWGEQIKSCVFDFSSGTSVFVTPTLRSTLDRLRPHCRTGYLWIDQLCIDQASIPDRNQQVALMGEIYSKCRRVLIWLGQEVHESEYMSYYFGNVPPLEFQQKKVHNWCSASRLEQPGPQSFVRFLLALPWFTRAWVVQEAVLPPRASCFLGPFGFSVEYLWSVIVHFRSAERYFTHKHHVNLRQLSGYLVLNEIMRLRKQEQNRGRSTQNEAICFYHSLSVLAPRCGTSSPHDTIFAFLGLQRDPRVRIIPDYDLDWGIVPSVATRAIAEATGSLDMFGVLHRRENEESRWRVLPSWVPDWSRTLEAEPMVFPRSWMYFDSSSGVCHQAKHSTGLSASYLVVAGKVVNEIHHRLPFTKGPAVPSANRHGWDVCSYLDIPQVHGLLEEFWPQDEPAPSIERLLKVVLADGSFTFNQKLREYCRDGLTPSYMHDLRTIYQIIENTPGGIGAASTRLRDHARVAWGRQVIVGRDWRLGLAHESACEGDLICIIHGSKVPLVLRRLASGHHRLIGQCYLEGAMRGEEVTWNQADADEFVLV